MGGSRPVGRNAAAGRTSPRIPDTRTNALPSPHWNTRRCQIKSKGLTPVEFREQALREAAYRL
ncbi:hypothetical protein E4J93_01465 [Collinsella sp. BA40]|nr:hypothetical protein E4J93_01465 [Collinsella sp. BA40]